MTTTVYAIFDGRVFKPEERLDLTPNQRYLIRVEQAQKSRKKQKNHVLQRILTRATDLGIPDLAEQHDHYLYGTEKR